MLARIPDAVRTGLVWSGLVWSGLVWSGTKLHFRRQAQVGVLCLNLRFYVDHPNGPIPLSLSVLPPAPQVTFSISTMIVPC
jgi:hypothetical protein